MAKRSNVFSRVGVNPASRKPGGTGLTAESDPWNGKPFSGQEADAAILSTADTPESMSPAQERGHHLGGRESEGTLRNGIENSSSKSWALAPTSAPL